MILPFPRTGSGGDEGDAQPSARAECPRASLSGSLFATLIGTRSALALDVASEQPNGCRGQRGEVGMGSTRSCPCPQLLCRAFICPRSDRAASAVAWASQHLRRADICGWAKCTDCRRVTPMQIARSTRGVLHPDSVADLSIRLRLLGSCTNGRAWKAYRCVANYCVAAV